MGDEMMTALQIIRGVQAGGVLWVNHERREAAFSSRARSACTPLDYNEAVMARTDTNLRIAEECDGEIVVAA